MVLEKITRILGILKGKIKITKDFDDPLDCFDEYMLDGITEEEERERKKAYQRYLAKRGIL